MQYFFDNCISYRYAECLSALGQPTVALRHSFAEGIRDVDLFRQLRGKDIVFVASDLKQLSRREEARELKRLGCSAIYFAPFWNKKVFWEQAAWIVSRWPTIDAFVQATAKGTIAEVKQNGKLYPQSL